MNNPLTVPARDGIEAQRGLNDIFPGDPYPVRDQLKRGLDVLRAKASRGKITSADVFSMTDPLMDILARIEATALERVTRERDEWERRAGDAIMGEAAAIERAESAEAKLAEARKEADTLRARLETVEAETRERCAERAESFSLAEHIAFDMREGIFPEQSDRQTAIADAIRNLEPRHD